MKPVFVFLVFAAFGSLAYADPLARQFAETIIRQNATISDEELDLSEWRQSVSGGYVMTFSFDINTDGKKEKFFASSFNADNLVCDWTVYDGASGKALGIATSLRPDGFWWNPSSSEMLDYAQFGAEGGAALLSRFDKNGVTTRHETAPPNEVTLGLGRDTPPRAGFQRFKPEVKICLLADIASFKNPTWRLLVLDDKGSNYGLPNGRLLLKEDAGRKSQLITFTPNDAILAIEKSTDQMGPMPGIFQDSDDSENRGSLPNLEPVSKQTTQLASKLTPPFWPWIAGACLVILAALVILKLRS